MTTTEIRLLGPLSVVHGGENIPVTARQPRTILSLLAASPGDRVSTDAIMTSLWPESPPEQARKTVQVQIWRLRKLFADDDSPILSVPDGYSLASDMVRVDSNQFDSLIREAGDTTDDHDAISLLSDAIALWHGPPFADLDVEELRSEASRLDEARIVAIERRIELRLRLGYHAEVVGELEALALEHPFREGIRAKQMLALYRSGRQADALRVYTRTRDELATALGLEPGPELQQLERDVLAQSADLDLFVSRSDEQRSVTFLVTDLEDSASLWAADPESMTAALTLHDEILEGAIVGQSGHVFKGTGEGLLAAMPTVDAALAAAKSAQRLLAEAEWPGPPLRVRMAIDAGDVEYRDGNYFGPALNRACRVMSSGHGGQLLLTEHALVGHDHDDVTDLGPHEYKGVGRVNVYQLSTTPQVVSFPPLETNRSTDPSTYSTFDHTIRGYELRERLGEGDFGIVYRAYQSSVGREVAIKVIRPEFANRPAFIRRFEVEAQLVAQLEHPHVVSLYDYWRDPDGAYLVMRSLKGGNLRSALDSGPLNPSAAKRLLDQVGSVLVSAHRQGVLHRDIKPANILLDEEGNAYLTDFGIAARHIGSDGGPLSTSPAYVSPEEIAGGASSEISDLYAFGMLAFETLTAVHPIRDQPLPAVSELRPELSPMIDQVLQKATAADPDVRYRRVNDFLRAMRQALGVDVVATQEESEPDSDVRNPYRGLRAFQETEAEDFFGRDALIDELVDAVESKPLVAVVGPSGSGKSSVVRAGLLPRLRSVGGDEPWFITEMFPGSYPFEELEGALARVAVDRLDGATDDLRADELGLTRVLKRVLPHDDSRLLLVIDQFEELFSLTAQSEVRELFLASLVAAAGDSRGRLHVVLTMRADFFHQPLGYGEFGDLLRAGLVAVSMPTRESLALAISRPARGVGLDLEPGLVNEIVRDVADEPGGLPLMQHALSELFHLRRGRTLTMDDYHESGGVLGALTRRADEIYGGLSEARRAITQQIFLRLVRADESAEDTRRRVRLSELYALGLDRSAVDDVLQDFGQFRLLSFDRDPITRGPTVEVGHEALIREWALLRGWVDDRREDLVFERRLEAATSEWISSDRANNFLLKEGRLAQFEDFAAGTDVRLTADESDFLRRSAEDAERAAKRATLRRRSLVAVLATFALVASTLAVFAVGERNDARDASELAEEQAVRAAEQASLADAEAERANSAATDADAQRLIAETQGLEARALQLAALADTAIADDPELAIHLALEAVATEELINAELHEVTASLYNSTFADRLVSRLQFDVAPLPGFLGIHDAIGAVNPTGTLGMQPTSDVDPIIGAVPTSVEIVQLSDGEVVETIEDPAGLSSFMWDPVTGEILTLSLAGEVSWRDTETMEISRTIQVQEGSMFLGRMGGKLTYGTVTNPAVWDLQTHVIDADTGAELFAGPPDAWFSRVSPSGDMVAILDDGRFIRVFDIATGEPVTVIDVPALASWNWNGGKDEIIYSMEPRDTFVVDPLASDVVLAQKDGFYLFGFTPSPDGRLLAAAGLENSVLLLDAETLEEVALLRVGSGEPEDLIWSADSATLVSSQHDGSSVVFDIGEVTTATRSVPRVSESLTGFDFVGEGQLLVGRPGGGAEIWDRASSEVTRTFAPRANPLTVPLSTWVRASPDGALLAVPQPETSVAIIDVADGSTRSVTTTEHHQPMAMSLNATLVLTVAPAIIADSRTGGGYAVHDTDTGDIVYSSAGSEGQHEWSNAGVFGPSSDLFLSVVRQELDSTGLNRTNTPPEFHLVLHDGESGSIMFELPLVAELVDMAVSSDGAFLAALDLRGTLRLYNIESMRSGDGSNAEFATAEVGLWNIAVSPDDKMVVSGADGALTARLVDEDLRVAWSIDIGGDDAFVAFEDGHVWTTLSERMARGQNPDVGLVGFPLDRDELVAYAKSKLSRELTESECQQYLAIGSCDERLPGSP